MTDSKPSLCGLPTGRGVTGDLKQTTEMFHRFFIDVIRKILKYFVFYPYIFALILTHKPQSGNN